jgi:hypothetical protein
MSIVVYNHLDAACARDLALINDDWPYQFLSEYTRFQKHLDDSEYHIVHDTESGCYIPVKIYKRKGFRFGQIKHSPVSVDGEVDARTQSGFFDHFIKFCRDKNYCVRFVQPPPSGLLQAVPAGADHIDFGSYIIDLSGQSEEEILGKFHPKYQKAVSHTARHYNKIVTGKEALDDFYDLYLGTMKRAGIYPVARSEFQLLIDYLGEERVTTAVIHDSERPVGAVFILATKYAAFVTHAGSIGKTKLYGSMKFLNYEMMKLMKSRGVKRYDFVGVRINNRNPALEGIFRFKQGFGGDLKKGYLWKLDINKSAAATFNLLQKVRVGKQPLQDIIDQVKAESEK